MAKIHAQARHRGAPQIRVTVTTSSPSPRAQPQAAPAPVPQDSYQRAAPAPALQPMRIGNDVFMVPPPERGPAQEANTGPSAAEQAFMGFLAWLGAKLDGL